MSEDTRHKIRDFWRTTYAQYARAQERSDWLDEHGVTLPQADYDELLERVGRSRAKFVDLNEQLADVLCLDPFEDDSAGGWVALRTLLEQTYDHRNDTNDDE